MEPRKEIPIFASEDEERAFWAEHDSTEFVDWKQSHEVLFTRLKPTTRPISIRLTQSMLAELRTLANQRDVPYQSLIKMFLQERINEERGRSTS